LSCFGLHLAGQDDVLEIKYYATATSSRWEYPKKEIRHITENGGGRFKNHALVGLKILKRIVQGE
jgi:hypothetical protein